MATSRTAPPLKTILVGTDFSLCAARALSFAISLAHPQSARIHILHVLSEPIPALDVAGAMPYLDLKTRREWEETSSSHLQREAKAAEKRGIRATTSLAWGRPSDVIIQTATEMKVSMVVVGTHGRSAFEQFLIGSTAERVVRRSPVPVLTVREKR
jgi:universal stress protein A